MSALIKTLKNIKNLELIDYLGFFQIKTDNSLIKEFKEKPKSIVFVCTGNICRSAYAEKKLQSMTNNFDLSSAGLETNDGKDANPGAMEASKRRNIDLSKHKTSIATDEILSQADLILIKDSGHYKLIKDEFKGKTKFLGIYANNKRTSIKDPYGKSQEFFDRCFDQIDSSLENLLRYLS